MASKAFVVLPIAETTTISLSSFDFLTKLNKFLIPSGFFTEAPPNLNTFIITKLFN